MAKRKTGKKSKRPMTDPTNWSKEKYYPAGKPTIKRTKKYTGRKN